MACHGNVRVLLLLAGMAAAAAAQEEVTYPYDLVPVDALRGHLMQGTFVEPGGVFFDAGAKELFVADTKNALIGIFTPEGIPLFAFGGRPVLVDPKSVATTSDGTVYVLDSDQTVIKRFSYRGEPLEPVRPAVPDDEAPVAPIRVSAFAVDEKGVLYVGDVTEPRLLIYDPDLTLRRVVRSEKGQARFQIISGIAVSGTGIVAVVDFKATPVQLFDREGNFLRGFGGRDIALEDFSAPAAVAFDEDGYLYAVDMLRHNVKIYDLAGNFQGAFGGWFSPRSRGRQPGEMLYPSGVTVAPGGLVYVAERFGNRVQLFRRQAKGVEKAKPRLRLPQVPGGSGDRKAGGAGGG